MKQVIQDFKSGALFVDEVPAPSVATGFVLVRNHYSLISAGTERSTVSTGKASLLGKARQRPDLVKQVLETLKREGLAETWKRVRTKLETLKELGYSSAGTVLMSLDTNAAFRPGDRVACGGGGYASHAGMVAVPQNLVVKVPDSVPLDTAAFTTLGSIAMQGVRQANPKLGEFVCVIGLGLLGQLTAQILRANGCQVFGIDTSAPMVELARKTSCHQARARTDSALDSAMDVFTEGHGFDAVIITAAAHSADPVELSTAILKPKGSMVVVGAVPMNIPREPHFYKKELELKISCSYGPGRYDHTYEEEGLDYPYAYVRWTENRNMAAFLRLLESKSVDVKPLITHVFEISDAERAYDIVTGKVPERHIALMLKYPETESENRESAPVIANAPGGGLGGIGFIGAGSFAQKFLIPYAKNLGRLAAVVTSRGISAKSVADKFGFGSFSTAAAEVFSNRAIQAVFIATRHDTHADLVIAALQAGKNVFVEKPLALERDSLNRIVEVHRRSGARLMVGFNRRFAPLALRARQAFASVPEPLVCNYRINAGLIPPDHWIQTAQGGGRILGEVCHFIDFLQFVIGAVPQKVSAECISSRSTKARNQDNLAITLKFANGSVGVITYLACGDRALPKERIEVFGAGKTFVINDFQTGEWYTGGACEKIKAPGKGHREEVEAFLSSIADGAPSPMSLESMWATTEATFAILDALRTGLPQPVAFGARTGESLVVPRNGSVQDGVHESAPDVEVA